MTRVLVLGGYGLIGAACLRALADAGFQVTGLGRSKAATRGVEPRAEWVVRDLTTLDVADWAGILQDVSVVVNAAGALQDGGRDDLEAIHVGMVDRMLQAAAGRQLRVIQVSAAGVSPTASTRFFRAKAAGDALIRDRAADWVILRPTLVIAAETYGGTALLRAAAALPGILPAVLPRSQVQTVDVGDVAAAVVQAVRGEIASGTEADLTEPGARALPDLILAYRRWLGLPEPRLRLPLPDWALRATSGCADLLGWLGWRSPLRSSAINALRDGVVGDGRTWEAAGGRPCQSLEASLSSRPATRADRLAARSYMALPAAVAVLSLFWTLSGLVALIHPSAATAVLTARGMAEGPALALVLGGILADLALGVLILWRPAARKAALGMAGVSLAYLCASLVTAPDLWADPLGPMVKVLPGVALALWVWLVLEER